MVENLKEIKKEAWAVLRLGNKFADKVEEYRKMIDPVIDKLEELGKTDIELQDLQNEMEQLSERLGM